MMLLVLVFMFFFTNAAAAAAVCAPRPADLRVDLPKAAPLIPLMPQASHQQQAAEQASATSSAPAPQVPSSVASTTNNQDAPGSTNSPLLPLVYPMGSSLFHPADRRWLMWLQQLWPKRGKDALLLMRKWLKEALRVERISPTTRSKLSSVVSATELINLAQCLVAQPGMANLPN
jgi:hypothetical protein